MNLGFAANVRHRRRLDLQTGEPSSHVVSSQHLDHLEVREGAKQVEPRVFGKPPDDLCFPEETKPAGVPLAGLQKIGRDSFEG